MLKKLRVETKPPDHAAYVRRRVLRVAGGYGIQSRCAGPGSRTHGSAETAFSKANSSRSRVIAKLPRLQRGNIRSSRSPHDKRPGRRVIHSTEACNQRLVDLLAGATDEFIGRAPETGRRTRNEKGAGPGALLLVRKFSLMTSHCPSRCSITGRSVNCAAAEKARDLIRRVAIRPVMPEAARIIATITNWYIPA